MNYQPANPATVPASGGCQPGVKAFEEYHINWWGLPTLGCYNPASTIPGGSPSLHRDGRAEDVGHDYSDEQVALVWELCRGLTRNYERLGCQQIIFQRQFWKPGQAWLPVSATTDPHLSHAHVEFQIAQSQTLTEQDFIETIGLPPMDDQTIDKLATAIVDKWFAKTIDVHAYDSNTNETDPMSSVLSFYLAELSQIRRHLTGQG